MSVKKVLVMIGTLAAIAAVVMGVVSTEVSSKPSVNPIGAIAVAVAAFGVLKASEHWS